MECAIQHPSMPRAFLARLATGWPKLSSRRSAALFAFSNATNSGLLNDAIQFFHDCSSNFHNFGLSTFDLSWLFLCVSPLSQLNFSRDSFSVHLGRDRKS